MTRPDYGKIRLAFEPNRGQAESNTSYLARGAGFLLSIEPDGSRLTMADWGKSAEVRATGVYAGIDFV